jgi:glucose-6-phosphate isomerase
MFEGEIVNETEGRPALHTALRNRSDRPVLVGGRDIMPDVRAVLAKMRIFSDSVRSGAWKGFTGKAIRAVVNIGIGGSDLGPKMAAAALDAWRSPGLEGHFVSNLDVVQLEAILADLDPETTLFLVASKTFGTQETLANARSARAWLVDALGDEAAVARHFVAMSTATERVKAFGIDPENMFVFWDWVGGRYSVWSAIGLSLAVLLGMDAFEEMLAGAHEMDEHFRTAPPERNVPVLMGLLGIWYDNFFGAGSHVVLPYDYALRLLPAHLQQLEMESNGKCVDREGVPIDGETCPILWGGPGNNGQHAFYQLLHQGTRLVPADFLVAVESQARSPAHQKAVLANALAQSEALMRGRSEDGARAELEAGGLPDREVERLVAHKVMPGNRPSTTILYERLTPRLLGALVALYEHKVFVQATIWGDNPFDQWGVELGKQLAGRILAELEDGNTPLEHDASTNALIRRVR